MLHGYGRAAIDIREINRRVIAQFRAGEEIEGMRRDDLLLLTTIGARSGEPRTSPMMFHREGERLFVIGSANGARRDPSWCHNLRARPTVTVEIGRGTYRASAVVLEGAARAGAWSSITAAHPFFHDHETSAAPRVIPVVELVPHEESREDQR
ncbi:nitroreductase/quinone reductase family protein [Nocardioides cremeus]|uniref:nitroreductase/quinone reductase family protein n=1 Tax=Nocardioides cremeus TaxID=3058044 RepID=UPI0030157C39